MQPALSASYSRRDVAVIPSGTRHSDDCQSRAAVRRNASAAAPRDSALKRRPIMVTSARGSEAKVRTTARRNGVPLLVLLSEQRMKTRVERDALAAAAAAASASAAEGTSDVAAPNRAGSTRRRSCSARRTSCGGSTK